MVDQTTLQRIQLLHPKIRREVEAIYREQIVPALTGSAYCRFAYTTRTFSEQNALYAQGRTKLFDSAGNRIGIVTKAKGGQSLHNYGLSLDIVLINGTSASWDTVKDFDKDGKSDWLEVADIFESNGWEWGGSWNSFKDYPHFQKVFGYSWQQLLAKYNSKDFIPGTTFVNI